MTQSPRQDQNKNEATACGRKVINAIISGDIVFYPTGFYSDFVISYDWSSSHNDPKRV
jgi:hypothetical protein